MATSQEKHELVEEIKGPRYYRITIHGYGGESAYMGITKEAFDFWHPIVEEHGDNDIVNYMVEAEEGDYDFENIDDLPKFAEFLFDAEDNFSRPWYEAATEFEHSYGVEYTSAYITIEEVEDDEYSSKWLADVIDRENLSSLVDEIEQWENVVEMGVCGDTPENVEYIAQMYSSEKGTFFEGIVETVGDFDISKLKIYTTEYLNGEDTVSSVEYAGLDIDNMGGDTNGKGYYGAVWKA